MWDWLTLVARFGRADLEEDCGCGCADVYVLHFPQERREQPLGRGLRLVSGADFRVVQSWLRVCQVHRALYWVDLLRGQQRQPYILHGACGKEHDCAACQSAPAHPDLSPVLLPRLEQREHLVRVWHSYFLHGPPNLPLLRGLQVDRVQEWREPLLEDPCGVQHVLRCWRVRAAAGWHRDQHSVLYILHAVYESVRDSRGGAVAPVYPSPSLHLPLQPLHSAELGHVPHSGSFLDGRWAHFLRLPRACIQEEQLQLLYVNGYSLHGAP